MGGKWTEKVWKLKDKWEKKTRSRMGKKGKYWNRKERMENGRKIKKLMVMASNYVITCTLTPGDWLH